MAKTVERGFDFLVPEDSRLNTKGERFKMVRQKDMTHVV
jgi:hypothetical protein